MLLSLLCLSLISNIIQNKIHDYFCASHDITFLNGSFLIVLPDQIGHAVFFQKINLLLIVLSLALLGTETKTHTVVFGS